MTDMMNNFRAFLCLFGLALVNLPVAFVDGVDCSKELFSLNLAATDWVEDITEAITGVSIGSLGAETDSSTTTCDSGVCSSAQYEISSTVTIDGTIAETVGIDTSVITAVGLDPASFTVDMTASASLSSEFCGVNPLCDLIFGSGWSSPMCAKLEFEFDLFAPTSCEAADNYNGFDMTWGYSYALMCCNEENCNAGYFADEDNTCDDDNDANKIAELVSGVNSCWNDIQQAAMIYMKCDLPNYLFSNIPSGCIDTTGVFGSTGEWTSDCMPYATSCNDDMLGIVGTLGSCLCEAVGEEDGYGDLIATVMSFLYSAACTDVSMTCTSSGMDMEITSPFIKFTLALAASLDVTDDTVQDDIKKALSEMGYIGANYIELEESGNDGELNVIIRADEDVVDKIMEHMFKDFENDWPEAITEVWDSLDDGWAIDSLSSEPSAEKQIETRPVSYVIGTYTQFPTSSPSPRPTSRPTSRPTESPVSTGSGAGSGSKDDDEEDFDFGAIWDEWGLYIILVIVAIAFSTAAKCFCKRRNSAKASTKNQQYVASAVNGGATGAVQQPATGQMQYGQQAAAGPTQMGQVQYAQVPTSAAPTV